MISGIFSHHATLFFTCNLHHQPVGSPRVCGKTEQVSYLFVFRLKPEQLAHLGVPASLIRGLLWA